MAEFDWGIFAQEIGKTVDIAVADIDYEEKQKRAEKRQIRISREMKDIELEKFNEKLEIEEPFKIKLDARLQERQSQLVLDREESAKRLAEWQEGFNRQLDIFSGSEGFRKAIKKAQKEGGLSQVAIMKMTDSLMRAKAGETVDMSDFEGLDPFDRLQVMDLVKGNNRYVEDFRAREEEREIEYKKLEELIEFRKRQAKSQRQDVLTQEQMDMNRAQVMAKRYADMRDDLNTKVEKAATEFDEYRTELFTELEDTNKTNKKGEAFATIGGKKKLSLLDDAGEINEEAVRKFTKHYPRYRGRFKRLGVLRKNVEVRNRERDEAFGGAPTGQPEVEVPEEEIRAAMEMGLTREQAIEQYRKFLATKR